MALTSPISTEQYTIPETMRSAVLFGPRDIRVIDRPVPQPGPGEVLVQVAMCGTCGSDLKIYDGHFPLTLPFGAFTPGHEWTGTVVALGRRSMNSPWVTGSVLKRITAAAGVITVSLANTPRACTMAMPRKAIVPPA